MGFGDDQVALGGFGTDRIEGGSGNDGTRYDGGGMFGGPGDDLVTGNGGDDKLVGDGYPDGTAGNDVLFGGGGADEMEGGDGNDLLLGGKGQDQIDAGNGNDVLVGNSAADTLLGGPGDDLIWATDFDRNSTDVIDPESFTAPGDNVIDCGDGNDMAVVDLADDRGGIVNCEYVIVLRSTKSNCSPVSRWLHGGPIKANLLDRGQYPENSNQVLDTASPFPEKPAWPTDEASMQYCADYSARYLLDPTDDVRPNVKGTDGDDELWPVPAGQAADAATLTPAGSPDGASVFNAGAGDDAINGSPGGDTALGGDGNDRIHGNDGDDASLEGEAGDDQLWGGNGNDVLFGRTGNDVLFGEDGNDYLEGGRGRDALSGGAGDDRLFGGIDADRLNGGAGDDEIIAYGGGADIVDCGPGFDVAEVDRRDRVRNCERIIGPKSAHAALKARARRR
jgi:Ca2+-binding RTX toxin-like protein